MTNVPGAVAFQLVHGELQAVLVSDLTAHSVLVRDCLLDGTPVSGVSERRTKPNLLVTPAAAARDSAVRPLCEPSRAVDEQTALDPDDVSAAHAIFDAIAGGSNGASYDVQLIGQRYGIRALYEGAATRAAVINGWPADPLTWHPAARLIPAALAANPVTYVEAQRGDDLDRTAAAAPAADVVVLPLTVLIAAARAAVLTDPKFLVRAGELDAYGFGARGLTAWREWLDQRSAEESAPSPGSESLANGYEESAEISITAALQQLTDSGLLGVPQIGAAVAALKRTLDVLGAP